MTTLKSFAFLALVYPATALIAMEKTPTDGVDAYLAWKQAHLIVAEVLYAPKRLNGHIDAIMQHYDWRQTRRVIQCFMMSHPEYAQKMSAAIKDKVDRRLQEPSPRWGLQNPYFSLLALKRAAELPTSAIPAPLEEQRQYLPEEIKNFPLIAKAKLIASDVSNEPNIIEDKAQEIVSERNSELATRVILCLMNNPKHAHKMATAISSSIKITAAHKIHPLYTQFAFEIHWGIEQNINILRQEDSLHDLTPEDSQMLNDLQTIVGHFPNPFQAHN
jgi:hypothetical protein